MIRYSVLAFAIACGGAAPAERTSSTPPPTAADLGPLCERHYERERVCVDEYLDALLDVRVEYDMPPGIAAEVEVDGRDAVLRRARRDWERDTAPEVTSRMCQAIVDNTPADQVDRLYRDAQTCAATDHCAAFAHCVVEGQRSYVRSGASH